MTAGGQHEGLRRRRGVCECHEWIKRSGVLASWFARARIRWLVGHWHVRVLGDHQRVKPALLHGQTKSVGRDAFVGDKRCDAELHVVSDVKKQSGYRPAAPRTTLAG
jgi:hypothetical protein